MVFGLERRRRDRLRAEPFPPKWLEIIQRNVPVYARLHPADQRELCGHVQVFVAEKNFEGAGGLEMTDEIRVTIAAQACLLLLHRDTDYYPRLRSIVVYPSAYVADRVERLHEGGFVVEGPETRLGESWHQGAIVLSWDHIRAGARELGDGHNVVFHEFAHQLDQEDGQADGVPLLERGSSYRAWARVLGDEFRALRSAAEDGRQTVLDEYGASHPSEFFAVATEAFFETPDRMQAEHPRLYAELKGFYQQDPARWPPVPN